MQDGRTSLMDACREGTLEVVKYLYEVGGKELLMAESKVSGLD
jgi:hypothetical protein